MGTPAAPAPRKALENVDDLSHINTETILLRKNCQQRASQQYHPDLVVTTGGRLVFVGYAVMQRLESSCHLRTTRSMTKSRLPSNKMFHSLHIQHRRCRSDLSQLCLFTLRAFRTARSASNSPRSATTLRHRRFCQTSDPRAFYFASVTSLSTPMASRIMIYKC